LERKHGHTDWQRYFNTPINQWPEWALKSYLGELTDEQLEEMIAELQSLANADLGKVGASTTP
jgi:hypothetical protein